MSHQTTGLVDPNVDPYGYLGLVRHPDGSITRLPNPSSFPVDTTSCSFSKLVVTKDLAINPSKNTYARVILPSQALEQAKQLPLVIYFHGGGFVARSVDTPLFQCFYAAVASEVQAIVVSVEYRLAPEHRLPAAYEDCMEALHWIKNKPDEWLVNCADFSKCFLMGTSAGGNIAYHLGLGLATSKWDNNLKPLEIRGLILHHPFFGGNERLESELRLANNQILPLNLSDIMWELALPEGADRDHEYSNPLTGIKSNPHLFDQVKSLGWKIMVTGRDGDPLIDRQINFAKVLKELGVQVVDSFTDGGFHGFEVAVPSMSEGFFVALKEFVTAA